MYIPFYFNLCIYQNDFTSHCHCPLQHAARHTFVTYVLQVKGPGHHRYCGKKGHLEFQALKVTSNSNVGKKSDHNPVVTIMDVRTKPMHGKQMPMPDRLCRSLSFMHAGICSDLECPSRSICSNGSTTPSRWKEYKTVFVCKHFASPFWLVKALRIGFCETSTKVVSKPLRISWSFMSDIFIGPPSTSIATQSRIALILSLARKPMYFLVLDVHGLTSFHGPTQPKASRQSAIWSCHFAHPPEASFSRSWQLFFH